MARKFKQRVFRAIGWTLVVLGVAGLVLPFLQGALLLLIGLSILASEYTWARRLLRKLRERFPGIGGRMETAGARARRWLKRSAPDDSDHAQS